LALAPALGPPARLATIVAAAPRFVDQGGRWVPSTDVVNLLRRAAMEQMKCLRL
jgi:hypothetical protein